MLSSRSRRALLDIRDNIRLAQGFLGNASVQEFEADRLKFYGVVRCLEIVSEASRRLDPEIRERHPELPWREIVAAGNVYRHGYGNITEDAVWLTVTTDLPALLKAVEAELG